MYRSQTNNKKKKQELSTQTFHKIIASVKLLSMMTLKYLQTFKQFYFK